MIPQSELTNLIKTSLQHLLKIVPFQQAALFLAEEVNTDDLLFVTLFAFRAPPISHFFILEQIPAQEGQLDQTLLLGWLTASVHPNQSNKLIFPVLNAIGDKRWDRMLKEGQEFLALPLVAGSQAIGILVLMRNDKEPFNINNIDIAMMFAYQLAVAMEKVINVEQVRATAITNERKRLSRDLHDSVTQQLHTASLIANTLPNLWKKHPQEANSGLQDVRLLILGAMANIRALLWELRSSEVVDRPLGSLLQQFTAAMAHYTKTKIHIETRGKDCSPLPKEVHLILYRIYQEALNNILKHADARNARVYLLCRPEGITLRIQDDGKGFKQQEITSQSLGIKFMRERASEIGATLLIISKPGRGTKVEITWSSSKDS